MALLVNAACFDIEANGLLLDGNKIHCIAIYDMRTKEVQLYSGLSVGVGILKLSEYKILIGHNILSYDIPMIKKIYPKAIFPDDCRDTLLVSQMLCADILGGHSLKAWGKRLNCAKGDYEGPWDDFSTEMGEYCCQDTRVTAVTYEALESIRQKRRITDFWDKSYKTEKDIAPILTRQMVFGFPFDIVAANNLKIKLDLAKDNLVKEIQTECGMVVKRGEVISPKRSRLTFTEGAEYCKLDYKPFSPASRDHVRGYLINVLGWKPKKFTPTKLPCLDQKILATLPYHEAKLFYDFFEINKRLGQLVSGPKALLKLVRDDNRIHGGFLQSGTVTRRFRHRNPNMSQIPACNKPWGKEFRSLFISLPGYVLVGIDAEALETRMLAGYLLSFDNGALIQFLESGDDFHASNAAILNGKNIKDVTKAERSVAKNWIYAFFYGASDKKLNSIHRGSSKEIFTNQFLGMESLLNKLKERYLTTGYLMSIDGCPLLIREERKLLNTLLQSAGSICMKKALKIFDDTLQRKGLVSGIDYEFVMNSHDEWQLVVKEELAETVGEIGVQSIREGGKALNFPMPLDGSYKIGQTWADTH